MLSKEERRFLRSWEEQRKGGRWSYYLLYGISGSVVLFIGIAFIFSMIRFGLPAQLWPIPVVSTGLAIMLTWSSWKRNEARFRRLVKREIEASREPGQDGLMGDADGDSVEKD